MFLVLLSAAIMTAQIEILSGFLQSVQQNSGTTPPVRPQSLPSTFFPIHYALPSNYSPMRTELLTASLNKLQMDKTSFRQFLIFFLIIFVMFINFYLRLCFYCCVVFHGLKT
jgi:hypothetical protein